MAPNWSYGPEFLPYFTKVNRKINIRTFDICLYLVVWEFSDTNQSWVLSHRKTNPKKRLLLRLERGDAADVRNIPVGPSANQCLLHSVSTTVDWELPLVLPVRLISWLDPFQIREEKETGDVQTALFTCSQENKQASETFCFKNGFRVVRNGEEVKTAIIEYLNVEFLLSLWRNGRNSGP